MMTYQEHIDGLTRSRRFLEAMKAERQNVMTIIEQLDALIAKYQDTIDGYEKPDAGNSEGGST